MTQIVSAALLQEPATGSSDLLTGTDDEDVDTFL